MSDQLRGSKDGAQDVIDLLEQAEEHQAENPQTEKALSPPLPAKESPTEKHSEQRPPVEKPRAVEAQVMNAQTAKPLVEESKLKKRNHIIMLVAIVLAVVMVIATVLVLLYNRWVKKPELSPEPSPSVSGSRPSTGTPSSDSGTEATPDINTVQPLAGGERRSEDFYTILIFGMDEVSGLTDTIMLASYDVTNQKATVMSIPRDTLVNNYTLYPINATYSQNGQGETGAAALKTEVSQLVGFMPDFYVTIDWELVGKMVEAIGGVEFEVPWRMKYDDPLQDLHIDLMPGLQTLNGQQAMQLVRWRQNNYGVSGGGDGSDLGRLNVQHGFLKAVLKQTLKPQNIVRVPELIRLFNENVVSDLSVENMLWFGQKAVLGGLNVDDVEFLTMPIYGTGNVGSRYYGRVCAIIDQLLTIINESLNPYVEDVTIRQLDLIQMSENGNTLSSTTGILKNPAAGTYTPPYSPPPETSDALWSPNPMESDLGTSDPIESGPGSSDPIESAPGSSDPVESAPSSSDPVESAPGSSDPIESDPGSSDPTESDPGTTDPTESCTGLGRTDDPLSESESAGPDSEG